ncbi:Mss4-like protein [Phellopilus nigrolimitatus]|nr:Mss4-like protein [Phellopilus nigrolimitatus]
MARYHSSLYAEESARDQAWAAFITRTLTLLFHGKSSGPLLTAHLNSALTLSRILIRSLPPFSKYPEDVEVKTWTGGCHCRRFTYEYDHPLLEASPPTSCNCSICTQKGELHAYGPESAFRFTKGSFDEAMAYAWGKKRSTRFFCPTCGCQLMWRGMGRVGVNVRTFDGIDVDKLVLKHIDGRSF